MQLIAEAYHLMKDGLGLSHSEMASILADWNQGELDSFLIEITANILKYIDEDGMPLVINMFLKSILPFKQNHETKLRIYFAQ